MFNQIKKEANKEESISFALCSQRNVYGGGAEVKETVLALIIFLTALIWIVGAAR